MSVRRQPISNLLWLVGFVFFRTCRVTGYSEWQSMADNGVWTLGSCFESLFPTMSSCSFPAQFLTLENVITIYQLSLRPPWRAIKFPWRDVIYPSDTKSCNSSRSERKIRGNVHLDLYHCWGWFAVTWLWCGRFAFVWRSMFMYKRSGESRSLSTKMR